MGKGGGGGGPTQTTATSYQTNLPEYARPYVDTMLTDRKSTRLNFSHVSESRMPSSA